MRNIIVLLLIAVQVSSCKKQPSDPPPPTPNISGKWIGSGIKSGISYTVTANLNQAQSSSNVTGDGEIKALFTTITFAVNGTNNYPDVYLEFSNPNPQIGSGYYEGKFDSANNNRIDGKATVPSFGLIGESLTMLRTQ
jgi:hypothetical protein